MSISLNTKINSNMRKLGLILAIGALFLSLFGCSKGADDMIETALGEIKSGNLIQAIQTLETLIEKHGDAPEAAVAHYYLSKCYWQTQQFDKSIESLKMAKAKTSPAEPQAVIRLQFELMDNYFKLKRFEEGEKIAASLLENPDPDVAIGANFQLVSAKMAQEKYDEAKKILERLKASENVMVKRQAYMFLANVHTKTEEYEYARNDYDALIKSATEDKDPKEEEALAALSPEEREKKLKDLVTTLEFEKTVTYGSSKDFKTAIEKMSEFVKKHEGHEYEAIAYVALGDFNSEMKETRKAKEFYRIAADKYMTIGAAQDDVERQAGLKVKSGEVYMYKLDDPEKAVEIFNEIIEKYAATRWAGKAQQHLAEIKAMTEAAATKEIAAEKAAEKAKASAVKEKVSGDKSDGYDEK